MLTLNLYNSPKAEIPNANDDPVLHYIVKKMHDTWPLWNRQSYFSLRHFPETHATPS